MRIISTELPEVCIIEPKVFSDERGYFFESYQQQRYQQLGIHSAFVQDNVSRSQKNVLRGLHYQLEHAQGKLVYVTRGAVMDVVVDVRYGSPTFGKSISVVLDDKDHRQLYVPPGFAHGFFVLADEVDFFYKCTDYYYPNAERGILWSDADLNINWPITQPILSAKDRLYLPLKDIPKEDLPKYAK